MPIEQTELMEPQWMADAEDRPRIVVLAGFGDGPEESISVAAPPVAQDVGDDDPPTSTIQAPPAAEDPDPREWLVRRAVIRFGLRLLRGKTMMPLFQFVRRLRELSATSWPAISDTAACRLVAEVLRAGVAEIRLVTPPWSAHAATGWVSAESEMFLG